ncbi:tail fiber assembly protein [Morganella morganii]|uniref:tail fiber assembly protein n=1 Tax=Morganella TaxID=581 RepID=UPI000A6FDAE3|nr:tail fiber assembly protein [Morganella morganii]
MTTLFLSQKYYKDSKNNVFCIDIDENNKDTWNLDIKKGWREISKEEAELIANPPPTKEQFIEQAEQQKQMLIAEVSAETEMLRTKLALKRIKPDEMERLNAWLDYLDELEAVDVSTAPDITWPVKPAV